MAAHAVPYPQPYMVLPTTIENLADVLNHHANHNFHPISILQDPEGGIVVVFKQGA